MVAIEKFWLKSASAPLAQNARVEWEFMVAGARETVVVTESVEDEIIAFEWSSGVSVKLKFDSIGDTTKVSATATGFKGLKAASRAIDTTKGFAIVLCDLKCLLDTGESDNMVRGKAALMSIAQAPAA